MRECFPKNRHVFFWKLPCERAYVVLLEQKLEKTHDVWKKYKCKPTDRGQHLALVHLACLFLSLLVMTL